MNSQKDLEDATQIIMDIQGKLPDWEVVYSEQFDDKQTAQRREMEVKKWKSRKKIILLIKRKKGL